MNGAQPIMPRIVQWGVDALPVLAAVLLVALGRQQTASGSDWSGFAAHCGIIMIGCLPLLAAHLAVSRLAGAWAIGLWLTGFLLFPLAIHWAQVDRYALTTVDWLTVAGFSIIALLARSLRRGKVFMVLGRLPITLDGAITALVGVFVLIATAMFASVDDPVNSQPFRVWFDPVHIAANPLASLGYGAQFAFAGALIFGFYWFCRYVLIRQVLRDHGWAPFLLASLAFWILYSPLAAGLALRLPLNPAHWSVLPSENHNPFDPLNYAFSAAAWASIIPLILASERLLAERSAAIKQRERARAELHMLRQQINPHFLFNALNTLYALCLNDRAASAEAIVKLSELLRYVVYQGGRDWVALDDEIAYLRNYIDLQMLRFGHRCQVACRWPSDAARYRIPPLLLIMLVENAFKHGVELSDDQSTVEIALVLDGKRMDFTCRNAPVEPAAAPVGAGVGLDNLRRRLELLIDDDFSLSSARDGNCWHAALKLDLRGC